MKPRPHNSALRILHLLCAAALAAASFTAAAQVVTEITGTSPLGGTMKLSLASPMGTCSFTSDTAFLNPAALEFFDYPKNAAFPHGLVHLRTTGCGMGGTVEFSWELQQTLPPTAQFWRYGPTPDDQGFRWLPVAATVNDRRITFQLSDGGIGDDNVIFNDSISLFGALTFPGGLYEDLWWGGSAENGWGMSLVQHADKLFANLYVYDASGNPIWYVMPSGAWNSSHNAFTGSLYLPTGSPFYAYDASRFNVGASVGTLTITFTDANNATMNYTINGVSARKDITRVLFGPQTNPTDTAHADLWWAGSAQNGWGLAVLQQYSTLFALWFTYDANGKAVWYVMPGGNWEVKDFYRGAAFKASGPPWLGVTYDTSKHHLTNVGSFDVRFSGTEAATFTYNVEGKTGAIPLTRIPF